MPQQKDPLMAISLASLRTQQLQLTPTILMHVRAGVGNPLARRRPAFSHDREWAASAMVHNSPATS